MKAGLELLKMIGKFSAEMIIWVAEKLKKGGK